jgi:hypothetical protein
MYNMSQFANPMQPPMMTFPPPTSQPAPPLQSQDQNSNVQQQLLQQSFQPASSQFNMSTPLMQTFETFPQVQTQINLQGMPPLTVNTPRIDPAKYTVP